MLSSPPYSGASPAVTAPVRSVRCLCPGTLIGVSRPSLGLRGERQPGIEQRRVPRSPRGSRISPIPAHPSVIMARLLI